jgi:hypothetical protein
MTRDRRRLLEHFRSGKCDSLAASIALMTSERPALRAGQSLEIPQPSNFKAVARFAASLEFQLGRLLGKCDHLGKVKLFRELRLGYSNVAGEFAGCACRKSNPAILVM